MTGYVYRGRKPDLGLDFEAVNAAIMAARATERTRDITDMQQQGRPAGRTRRDRR